MAFLLKARNIANVNLNVSEHISKQSMLTTFFTFAEQIYLKVFLSVVVPSDLKYLSLKMNSSLDL